MRGYDLTAENSATCLIHENGHMTVRKVRGYSVDRGTVMNSRTTTNATAVARAVPQTHIDWTNLWRRLVGWFVNARSHRVICLVIGLWMINGFDVVLTVLAHQQGMLAETNPIAEKLLAHSPVMVAVFKATLVTFASTVLIVYRRKFLAEIAAAGMLFIYTIVAVQWRLCYELYMLTHIGDVPVHEIDAVGLSSLGLSSLF